MTERTAERVVQKRWTGNNVAEKAEKIEQPNPQKSDKRTDRRNRNTITK